MHAGRGGGLWFLTANCLILSNPPLTAVSHTFILTGLWSICWTMLRGNTHRQGSRDGDRLSGLAVSKGRHRYRRAWCLLPMVVEDSVVWVVFRKGGRCVRQNSACLADGAIAQEDQFDCFHRDLSR